MKLLGILGVTRWVLRLLLLPPFLLREIWRRLTAGTNDFHLIRRGGYAGGPVAVVALYQDGRVRADILSLFLALRRRGVYTIAVNTGALSDAGARLPVDCYVERQNYGRDFGSYRLGLQIAEGIAPKADRTLLLNDSVFYVSGGLDKFLQRLLFNSADICSATESNEVLPHQTSFCLSFSRKCTQHPAFRRFWRRYITTDLRPMTVILGEITLSRVLGRTELTRDTLASQSSVSERLAERALVDGDLSGEAMGFAEHQENWSIDGNLTHRVPNTLLDLGLPMIKLDLPLRAGKTDSELESILGRLAPVDSQTLGELWLTQTEKKGNGNRLDRLGALCGLA